MGRFPSERLLRVKDDPDLGRLQLWAWPEKLGVFAFGQAKEEFLEWRGSIGSLPIVVGVDRGTEAEAQLDFLDRDARATIAALGTREPALRRETAAREIELARDWAHNPALTEDEFAQLLRASQIDVYTDAVDTIVNIYFEDTANIFAGHVVTTRLDKHGAITDTGIDG